MSDDSERPLVASPSPADSSVSDTSLAPFATPVLDVTVEDPPDQPLSPKQRSFVEEYIVDLNGTRAAIRAGYSKNGAEVTASQLLRLPKVRHAVDHALAHRTARVNMTAESVLSEMAMLAKSSIDHYIITDDGYVKPAPGAPPGVMGAISSMKRRKIERLDKDDNLTVTYEVEIRLWNKPEPLKLMGRHVGLNFNDRLEITGKGGGPIEIAAAKIQELSDEELEARAKAIVAEVISSEPV